MELAVRIRNLYLAGSQIAPRPVSLDVHLGEGVGICGPRGMGKGLLLHILSGLRPAEAEALEVLGQDARREPRRVSASVGFVSGSLDDFLWERSAYANLALHAATKGLPAARLHDVVQLQLGRHGLRPRAATAARLLPHTDLLRLALAQATVAAPRLLLLYDPLRGAGDEEAAELFDTLAEWLGEDPSHTLIAAGPRLRPLRRLLRRGWLLEPWGLVPCAAADLP